MVTLSACGDADRSPSPVPPAREPASAPAESPTAAESPTSPDPRRCKPSPGLSGSPTSIAEAVALLDVLPAPVTVACFVESLDRPLRIIATASPLSAQPAVDVASPRILIRNGTLTMAVVPAGMGKRLLEFGEDAGEGRTIKGEVELPLERSLRASAPYDRVLATEGKGTSCGVCHDDEAPAPGLRPGLASEILRPTPEFEVPLDDLRQAAARCSSDDDDERCALLTALFDHGPVLEAPAFVGGRICDH